jgi:predicted GIY-YIG superfamily endonuclease
MWNVYVIELSDEVLKHKRFCEENPNRNPDLPCLYVGYSDKSPHNRFEEHKAGIRSNSYVERYHVKLRSDLFEKYNPIRSKAGAERMEETLAKKLQDQGHGVWVGLGAPKW